MSVFTDELGNIIDDEDAVMYILQDKDVYKRSIVTEIDHETQVYNKLINQNYKVPKDNDVEVIEKVRSSTNGKGLYVR